MRNMYRNKGLNRILGVLCALVLFATAIYVPMAVSAVVPVNSVEIKDDEAFVFDFSEWIPSADNTAAATAEGGIGYYGWGWDVRDGVLKPANASGRSWATGGGFRLHTKLADGSWGLYGLEPTTRYAVSFKIRVLSSPKTVDGSKETNKTYVSLAYNMKFDPKADGQENNYINRSGTTKTVYESLIDSDMFTLYDTNGVGTSYACGEKWYSVTYFITTPAEFTNDNALGFYCGNYTGSSAEIDDVSVTKIGADSGVIVLKDEYSGIDELFFGKEGTSIDLSAKDLSDRAQSTDHTFEGWYADAARTEKITSVAFSKTADKTVYSRWNAPVTVTFKNTLDGTETSVTGMAGDMFEYPADPVDPEGKVWFMGWYKDEGCTVPHTVPQYGYANETIYTLWKGDIPGLEVDFENYTKDAYTIQTDANGQKYKSNRLIFAPTMTKQSEVTYGDSNYAVKYHWNPVQITDKNDHNYYDTARVTSYDNYFYLGKGLENQTLYTVTFKYLAEKAPSPVSFYMVTGIDNNAWGSIRQYDTLKNYTLETDGEWHEISFLFTPDYKDTGTTTYLGINNIDRGEGTGVETIVYFDDVKVEAFAQPYESVITINTNINDGVIAVKGKRGEKIEWPEIVHPQDAPFGGYYLDKGLSEEYTSEVYERLPVTVYAQWLTYSGVFQDFEAYTADKYSNTLVKKNNDTPDDPDDDYTLTYRSNYLKFYTTMSKQSDVVYSGNNAVKFEWNTDKKYDKDVSSATAYNAQNPDSYEHKRYTAMDNLFWLGGNLENNQFYTISFKYRVEKGDQEVQFYALTAHPDNSWGGRKSYLAPEKTKLKVSNEWQEYSFTFTTESIGSNNIAYLGITLTEHKDTIVYFDDVEVKGYTNSAEVLMWLNTATGAGTVMHVGKRGDAINLPKLTHAEGAEFLGWYLDASFTIPFEADVYPTTNTKIYAKWAPYAMTFKEYPYGGGAGPYSDPNISLVHQKGVGNGDDHAMRFYVNRTTDNTTGLGTSQAIQIAAGIKDGAVYRVKFDYKSTSIQTSPATLVVATGYPENIWVSASYNKYVYTNIDLPKGGTNGWKSAEFIIKAGVKTDGYHHGNALFLRYSASISKAGDKIDAYIDNVLVELVEPPYVFFDAQNGKQAEIVTGEVGDEIKIPNPPSRVGYTFEGWYYEPECENKFDTKYLEAGMVMTVYAKWKESTTFIYSFENYTRSETSGWALRNAALSTKRTKSGKNSLRAEWREENNVTNGVFALEDSNEMFKLERNREYVVTFNYYIEEVGDGNLGLQMVASAYNNVYVGRNTAKTNISPSVSITPSEGRSTKGKWLTKSLACTTTDLTEDIYTELYVWLGSLKGWVVYFDDVTVRTVPKGQVAVSFNTEGAKGCPEYLIGKPGADYSKKIPEALTKEGMTFKGYYTKSADGSFLEKTRGNMVFGEKSEVVFGRFLDREIQENFDKGFYEKAYSKGFGYTIHDFDYEVYDSEKEGNSKDNVTSGKYSLHRKGDSMYKENTVILTLGNQIAEGERYTVSFKVKLGKHFHTDGAVKLVSSRSFEYAWTTTGDYYPVVPIADLADGQWHEVIYTFNSVEAFVTLQTPGYVELFFDDFKFTLVDESVPLTEPKEYTEYVAAERDANGNLLYKDRTAVDISTIIDASLDVKPFPWLYVYIGGGVLVLAAVALVLILVVFKKKKA